MPNQGGDLLVHELVTFATINFILVISHFLNILVLAKRLVETYAFFNGQFEYVELVMYCKEVLKLSIVLHMYKEVLVRGDTCFCFLEL